LLPIGAYNPQWFLQYIHTNPAEALKAHVELRSKKSFGMHNETFSLSATDYIEAKNDLKTARIPSNVSKEDFDVIQVGQSFRYKLDKGSKNLLSPKTRQN